MIARLVKDRYGGLATTRTTFKVPVSSRCVHSQSSSSDLNLRKFYMHYHFIQGGKRPGTFIKLKIPKAFRNEGDPE